MSYSLDAKGRLVPGRHRTTLPEIEQFFVEEAPCSEHRRRVFTAFTTWVELLRGLSPSAILWINGGFATYKNEPPKDVDVAALIGKNDINSWTAGQQVTFETLLTDVRSDGTRLQPMGGLVDGFYAVRGDIDQSVVWHESWSAVYVNGVQSVGESKGYLEVRLADG